VHFAGFVPGSAARSALREAVADIEADEMEIADGNPENFESEATAALGLFPLLDTARIDYDGERWVMTGAVADPQAGLNAKEAFAAAGLRDAGWAFAIDYPEVTPPPELPVVSPYVWSATKGEDGHVVLTGHAPTEGFKTVFASRAGADVADETTLAAGQPEDFVAGALAGFDALLLLNEGTLSFDGSTWSLTGAVATGLERKRAESSLPAATDASRWKVAIRALDEPPTIADYTWSATKAADGRVSLAGYVPNEEIKSFVAVRAGTVEADTTALGSGEPVGFVGDVLAGLEALTHLSIGTVKYERGTWTLAGVPETAESEALAVAALVTATDGGAGWVKAITAPVAPEEPVPEAEATAAKPEAAAPEATTEVAALPEQESVPAGERPAAAAADPVARVFRFSAMKPLDGPIDLAGAVPAEAARSFFGVIAGEVPTDALTIRSDLPPEFIAHADAGIRLLATLDAGEFGIEGDTWVLNGRVESEGKKAAALEALAELPQSADWQTEIALLPPIDVCRRHVAALASRNAILFQSGSARLAEESFTAIDELAGYLGECPDATVEVEGHTDADGDEESNLALSVARAETVVSALIERGVAYQRLYAIGYGESLPIADNETTAGKRANRRIAFTILDQLQ
jgi:outer membrane protein OmpA-like peptidoglycan-associated protein